MYVVFIIKIQVTGKEENSEVCQGGQSKYIHNLHKLFHSIFSSAT